MFRSSFGARRFACTKYFASEFLLESTKERVHMFDYDKAFDGVQRPKPIDVLQSKSTDTIIGNFNGDKRQQHNVDDSCPTMDKQQWIK